MRHVVVMTTTGMLGLTFMFLVDAATLFWVSQLKVEMFVAAMGFAWTIQFFTISTAVGFMIGATARVSRSLGQGDLEKARVQTSVAVVLTCACQAVLAFFLFIYRREVLAFAGASGDTLEVAQSFLAISVPSLPIMAVSMIGSATLRAEGDAMRAMYVTISIGVVAVVVDPFLIFGLDLGTDGAAWGVVVSRTSSALLATYYVVWVKNLAAPIGWKDVRHWAWPFFVVALPAALTQVSSPFGNYIATRAISEFGEAAVAGWAVLTRLLVVFFGGIFALSGAIGGIIGQNFGAGLFDRVRSAYRDALVFSVIYVLIAWALMAVLTNVIASGFGLTPDATEVLKAFTYIAAGAFVFYGALYVSNAAFNNLDRPLYSTALNWLRDGVLTWPFCMLGATYLAAPGVVYGQNLAGVLVGSIAVVYGWYYISSVEKRYSDLSKSP